MAVLGFGPRDVSTGRFIEDFPDMLRQRYYTNTQDPNMYSKLINAASDWLRKKKKVKITLPIYAQILTYIYYRLADPYDIKPSGDRFDLAWNDDGKKDSMIIRLKRAIPSLLLEDTTETERGLIGLKFAVDEIWNGLLDYVRITKDVRVKNVFDTLLTYPELMEGGVYHEFIIDPVSNGLPIDMNWNHHLYLGSYSGYNPAMDSWFKLESFFRAMWPYDLPSYINKFVLSNKLGFHGDLEAFKQALAAPKTTILAVPGNDFDISTKLITSIEMFLCYDAVVLRLFADLVGVSGFSIGNVVQNITENARKPGHNSYPYPTIAELVYRSSDCSPGSIEYLQKHVLPQLAGKSDSFIIDYVRRIVARIDELWQGILEYVNTTRDTRLKEIIISFDNPATFTDFVRDRCLMGINEYKLSEAINMSWREHLRKASSAGYDPSKDDWFRLERFFRYAYSYGGIPFIKRMDVKEYAEFMKPVIEHSS